MLTPKILAACSGVLLLALSSCDIPDRTSSTSSRVASKHCERATGSLVCSDGSPEGPIGTVGDTSMTQTSFGAKGN